MAKISDVIMGNAIDNLYRDLLTNLIICRRLHSNDMDSIRRLKASDTFKVAWSSGSANATRREARHLIEGLKEVKELRRTYEHLHNTPV